MITAGTLAATGDCLAAAALVIGAIALFALFVCLITKKAKRNKKTDWKYPF